MSQYIKNTAYSTSELIKLIFDEENSLNEANESLNRWQAKAIFYQKEYTDMMRQ